ncbi:MAG: response regulator [Chloroflexi bacterium]|jgi:CheY-like chemotaxis protein|nr:response regulator [Chloroflexota bacterium]
MTMAQSIAVINDDRTFLSLMCELLASEGYEPYAIPEASEAFHQLRAAIPDAIILDIRLGNPTGWQVLELIKLDPNLAHIPVIICSADVRSLVERHDLLRKHGCRELAVPFTLDELLSMLREELQSRSH